MKKSLKFIVVTLITILSVATFSYASDKKTISNVAVTGIDAPYSESRELDTTGEVAYGENYRIIDVSWGSPSNTSSGYYEVTITLKANVGFIFSGDTTGSVNDEAIKSKKIIDDDEMSITYVFDENSSSVSDIGNATNNTRYRIIVYCDKEEGTITPAVMRVLKGSNQTVKITPNEGYKIKDVKVDGESVGAVSEYTFNRVKDNHKISAQFEKIEETEDNEDAEINTEEVKPLLKVLLNILKAFNS